MEAGLRNSLNLQNGYCLGNFFYDIQLCLYEEDIFVKFLYQE